MDETDEGLDLREPLTEESRTQGSELTRSGARRLGDEYQDAVALDILVDWLEHSDRYRWVRVEDDDSGALDDVVALRTSGVMLAKQVKYSTNPDFDEDRFTLEWLFHREKGVRGRLKSSLAMKWSKSLSRLSKHGGGLEAELVSNRQPSP
jgi:hypothetical protein